MPVRPRSHLTATIFVAALLGLGLLPGAAGASSSVITPQGVGAVRLGATVSSLHRQGLIGTLRKGCELVQRQRVAPLRAPLSGWAIFSGGSRVTSIEIDGGAETARGIGIGSTIGEARAAYPSAEWRSPKQMAPFAIGLLTVLRHRRAKLSFLIAPGLHRVESIAIPSPNFCE